MAFDGKPLSLVGLNLQAVINLKDLPLAVVNQLTFNTDRFEHYSQLILIGHGGRLLWRKVKIWQKETESAIESENPIDDFSIFHAERFFSQRFSSKDFEIIFPTSASNQTPIGLPIAGVVMSRPS